MLWGYTTNNATRETTGLLVSMMFMVMQLVEVVAVIVLVVIYSNGRAGNVVSSRAADNVVGSEDVDDESN